MTGRTNPYVGLVPYTETDAGWFFGRSSEQRIVAANMRSSRLTLLYGASGVGKTSVLLAGVVAGLRQRIAAHRAMATVPASAVRVVSRERAPFAATVFSAWRDAPLRPLAAAIRASVQEATGEAAEPWDEQEPFADAVRRWTEDVHQLLLVLDQFEEYFLYHPEESAEESFDQVLAELVNEPDLRIHFLLSIREDAWAKLDRFKGRIPIVFDNYLRVDYLAPAEAHEAILGPIERYNSTVGAAEPPVSIQPALVEQVLHDVRTGRLDLAQGRAPVSTQPATASDVERVETPYLQLVMERLWDTAMERWVGGEPHRELTLEMLRDLGGAEAIVARHLNDALGALPGSEQEIAAGVFEFLVTPSKTKIAHRASDLAHFTKQPAGEVQHVLEVLAARGSRILREVPSPEGGEDVTRYELYHDVLAEALLKWCATHAEEREKRALEERVRAQEAARRKARRDRILRRLGIAGAVVVVALLVAAGVALLQQRTSDDAAKQASATELAADAEHELDTDPQGSLLLARKAVGIGGLAHAQAREALLDSVRASHVAAILGGGPTRPCVRPCPIGGGRPMSGLEGRLSSTGQFGGRLSFDPDGRVAVVLGRRVVRWDPQSGDAQRVAGLSDVATAKSLGRRGVLAIRTRASAAALEVVPFGTGGGRRVRVASSALGAAISSDGRYAAVPGFRSVTVRRLSDGQALVRLPTTEPFAGWPPTVAFDPRDPMVLAVGVTNVALWRWRTHQRAMLVRTGRHPPLFNVRFSADGRLVAALGADGTLDAWSVRTPYAHRFGTAAAAGPGGPKRLVLSPDGRRALVVDGKLITLRSTFDGHVVSVFSGQTDGVDDAGFSPDGSRVVTAHLDHIARVWDAEAGTMLEELRGHTEAVTDAAFTPNGSYVVTIGRDGTARLWDVRTGPVLRRTADPVVDAAVGPRGTGVALLTRASRLMLWEPASGARQTLTRLRGSWSGLAVADTPRGPKIAVGLGARPHGTTLALVDARTGAVQYLRGGGGSIQDVAFGPGGTRLLTVGEGRPRVWSTASGRPRLLGSAGLRDPGFLGISGGFAANGSRVVIARGDGRVELFDAASGDRIARLNAVHLLDRGVLAPGASPLTPFRAALSPTGRTVAIAGPGGAMLWDSLTRSAVSLEGHVGAVASVAFSPHGRYVVSAGADGTLRVWRSAGSGGGLAADHLLGGGLELASFVASGREILAVGGDGTVQVIRCLVCLKPPEIDGLAKAETIRPFTANEKRLLRAAE